MTGFYSKQWQNRADLSPRHNGLRNRKLNRKDFEQHVIDYPDALQRERAAHFKVSVSSIQHALKRMGATRKKNRRVIAKEISPAEFSCRAEAKLDAAWGRRVYLDETGFERAAYRPWAWAPKGRKVLLGSVTEEADREPTSSRPQPRDHDSSDCFLRGTLMPSYSITTSKNNCLSLACSSWIMPPFTKLRKTRELIEESGHELLFLPPYSPDRDLSPSLLFLSEKRMPLTDSSSSSP